MKNLNEFNKKVDRIAAKFAEGFMPRFSNGMAINWEDELFWVFLMGAREYEDNVNSSYFSNFYNESEAYKAAGVAAERLVENLMGRRSFEEALKLAFSAGYKYAYSKINVLQTFEVED